MTEDKKNIEDQNSDSIYIIHEKFEKKYDTHQHEKDQLSYVEDGIAYVTYNNQTFVVPSKHFFWIPKNRLHKIKVSHSATQLHSIYFPETQKTEDDFYLTFGIYPATELICSLIKFTERWDRTFINSESNYYELVKGLYHVISEEKHRSLYIMLPISDDPKITKVTDYIQIHYDKPLSLDLMTKTFNMSKRSFTRIFKKELGITFMQYLKSVRITMAIELILKTNLSIAEISDKVGYNSLPSFSHAFLKFTGQRPKRFEK